MKARRAIVLAVLFVASAANANTPGDYAWTFPVETGAATAASDAWRLELTPEVYAWVQDADLRDIEVFNAAGQPVPLARYAPASGVRERDAALPALALPASATRANANDLRLVIDRDADGRLRRIDAGEQASTPAKPGVRDWLLDASAFDHPIDRIVIAWSAPTSGVVARFGVEASDDLQAWYAAGSGTVLALEQDGAHLERHAIDLADVRGKYLRLRRLDDGAELVGLSARAHAFERDAAAPARIWLDAAIVSAPPGAADTPAGVTRHDYVLRSALPVEAARIELANANALAPLTLFVRTPENSGSAWSELARITAFRLRAAGETLRNADIELGGIAPRRRQFRIESQAPLASPPRLVVGYRPDSLVFLAEGDAPYVLAVGSLRAQRAAYPVDAALASLRAKFGAAWQPPLAHLGTARESAGAAALRPLPQPTPWRRWLLWGVLVAGAALVGGFALTLLRGAHRDPH